MILGKEKLLLILLIAQSIIVLGQEKFSTAKNHTGFIENKGQIHDQNYKPNPDVKYLLNLNNGLNVQLRTNGFSYDTYIIERTKKEKGKEEMDMFRHPFDSIEDYDIIYHFHRIDIELLNSNPNPEIIAESPSADYQNYYNTVTPEEGAPFVHSFQKVTYKDIYPGVDLEFFVQENEKQPVKYNFIVHPGADVSQIKLRYNGANNLQLDNGIILIETANGNFHECLPESWLQKNKQPINAQYKSIGENTFGFQVSEYASFQTLVIDPLPFIDWATYYGGSENDAASSIKVDQYENVYLIGTTKSNSNIATAGSYQDTFRGNEDAFLVKMNTSGQRIWGTYIGGNNKDYGAKIDITQNGFIYITGNTRSNTGIATSGVHKDTISSSKSDAFIIKLNLSGIRIWGTYFGGSDDDYANSIVVCNNGHLYISGVTESTNGISTAGTHQTVNAGGRDAFIARFDSTGQRISGTYCGGTGTEYSSGIAIDSNETIYLIGRNYNSVGGIASAGAHQTSNAGAEDVFISKFDSLGKRIWGTYYGGSSSESPNSITVDHRGFIYISGSTYSVNNIATTGTYQSTKVGGNDAYLVKFDSSGNRIWGTYFGGLSVGNYTESITDITTDLDGNIYCVGSTPS